MKCNYCKKEFENVSSERECSLKCRILKKCKKTNKCWIWLGSCNQRGYGRLKVKKKLLFAHRISYEIFKGDIPEHIHVCHTCDNPGCINPKHLFLGTAQDNHDDMVKKERRKSDQGEANPGSKLKNIDVINIRYLLKNRGFVREIALKYDISTNAIYNIKNGKTWTHI